MTAFSPFIPHNDRDSSMPVALFRILGRKQYRCADRLHDRLDSRQLRLRQRHSHFHPKQRAQHPPLHLGRPGKSGTTRRSRNRYRRRRCRTCRLPFPRSMVRQPRSLTGESSRGPAASASGTMRNRAQQGTCSSSPSTARLAVRVRVMPGETRRVRFAISWNYPFGSIYWFNRDQPGSPLFEGQAPDLEELLRDPMGGFGGERGRRFQALGNARSADHCLPRFDFRLVAAARDHRRGQRYARHPPFRNTHPAGGR